MTEFQPKGVYPAVPTAIEDDGSINYEAMENLVTSLEDRGIEGVVLGGCTGQAYALGDMGDGTYDEHVELISRVADMTDESTEVIAGDGMNTTEQTTGLVERIDEELGDDLDAHMVITPYVNGPPQDRLVRHYEEVAESADQEIVAYNVPGRTGVNIEPRTLERIAEIDGVVGIKEASNDPEQIREYGGRVRDIDGFELGSGDDARNDLIFEEGGSFAISVSANIYPEAVIDVFEAAYEQGDFEAAGEINTELNPLHDAMFQEGEKNPISVHYALNQQGFDFGTPRAPNDRAPHEGYDETHNQIFTNQTEIDHTLELFGIEEV